MRSPQSSAHDFLCKRNTRWRGGGVVGLTQLFFAEFACLCIALPDQGNCAISHETQSLPQLEFAGFGF